MSLRRLLYPARSQTSMLSQARLQLNPRRHRRLKLKSRVHSASMLKSRLTRHSTIATVLRDLGRQSMPLRSIRAPVASVGIALQYIAFQVIRRLLRLRLSPLDPRPSQSADHLLPQPSHNNPLSISSETICSLVDIPGRRLLCGLPHQHHILPQTVSSTNNLLSLGRRRYSF